MAKTKKLEEIQGGEVRPNETLEPVTKLTKILVDPELFRQVLIYLENSIPKTNTVAEVFTLIQNLQKTSQQSEVTFTNGTN